MRNSDGSKRVLDVCDALLALASEERVASLQVLTEQDPQLAFEVRQLLQAVDDSGSFMAIDKSPQWDR